jgi:hypothetical protein
VINPRIAVAMAGGVAKPETVYPQTTRSNVLFMASDQMELLVESLNSLSGERRGGLPASFPRELRDFLTVYLPADITMFGQLFTFATVPNVLSVQFMDEEHTKAEVAIRTWSSGGTLLMEKQQGQWHVVDVGTAYVN